MGFKAQDKRLNCISRQEKTKPYLWKCLLWVKVVPLSTEILTKQNTEEGEIAVGKNNTGPKLKYKEQ